MRLAGAANGWLPSWLRRILPDLHEETGTAIAHRYVLIDMSYNGVLINGHRAEPAPAVNALHSGDRIHIRGFKPVSFVFATETLRPAPPAVPEPAGSSA